MVAQAWSVARRHVHDAGVSLPPAGAPDRAMSVSDAERDHAPAPTQPGRRLQVRIHPERIQGLLGVLGGSGSGAAEG